MSIRCFYGWMTGLVFAGAAVAYGEEIPLPPITPASSSGLPAEIHSPPPLNQENVPNIISPMIPAVGGVSISKNTPVAIQGMVPIDLETEKQRLLKKLVPVIEDFFRDNLVKVHLHLRSISYFAPVTKGGAQLRQVRLPGFESNVWIPAEMQQAAGFLERQQPYVTLFVVIQEPVESNYLQALKQALARNEDGLNFDGKDALEVVVLGKSLSGVASPASPSPSTTVVLPDKPEPMTSLDVSPNLEPQFAERLLKARTAFFGNQLQQALTELNEAIQLSPQSPQAYEMLGSVYYHLNWKRLAIQKWEKALELDPQNQKLRTYLEQLKRLP